MLNFDFASRGMDEPFSDADLQSLLRCAHGGLQELFALQRRTLGIEL